jgi:hypothetical protein
MGLAEITDRSRQQASRWVDRLAPAIGGRNRAGGGLAARALRSRDGAAAFELFRNAAPRRFFAGIETGDAAEILRDELPAACRDIVAVANGVCTRSFDLLGYKGLTFGESIDWHLDPVAGRRAPRVHWSRIDPLDEAMVGDSKVTWELNRHQWLLPLAQAYWLTADKRYAQEAVDLVDDWTRANPYGIGINWASSLEVAYRLIAWSWAFVLIRDAAVFSTAEFSGWLAQVQSHANHVGRYLSRYYSPNTHLTGEALGLFYAGVLFPELAEAPRWRRLGRQILIDECRRQIHQDGVYFEQATCYQQYTIDIYLHFLMLADRNNVAVPADVRQRVEHMLQFFLAVHAPDGSLPPIGDADGGHLLPLARRAPGDCRATFATGAVLFNRADFLWAAGGPAPEVLWLLGVPGWDAVKALESRAPGAPASAVFRQGGYVVMRDAWTREAHELIFDVGPLGCPVSGAHGHADLLSVQVWAFGEPYIVDPGTFCYTADAGWRRYFRSTEAHSTITIDGLPQAEPRGPFTWRARPSASLRAWTSSEASDFADASHDAYAGLPDHVVHRRRVLFLKPRFWVVIDDLTGSAEHAVALRFQFASRRIQAVADRWVAAYGRRGGLWAGVFSAVPVQLQVREGVTDPAPEGWISTHYGRRQPAPMVTYSARAKFPLRIATLLLPVEQVSGRPPAVTPGYAEDGRLTTLSLVDSGEQIRFDDERIVIEPALTHSGGTR